MTRFEAGAFIRDPAISPDGKQVAFSYQPPAKAQAGGGVDFGGDLYVMDRDGSNRRLLAQHAIVAEYIESPAWIDNQHLIFGVRSRKADTGDLDLRVELIDVSTGVRKNLLDHALTPAIAPDRKTIAYVNINAAGGEELTVNDVTGGAPRILVSPSSNLALISSITFSPDGQQIAFAAVDFLPNASMRPPATERAAFVSSTTAHPFAQDIWLVNRDGSNLHRLSDLAENMPSLSWTGDSKSIYVLGPVGFWLIGIANGQAKQIGSGMPFAQMVATGR